jgi:hypothetical protein
MRRVYMGRTSNCLFASKGSLMSIFTDPRDYIDVESQSCEIGTGFCDVLADGTCEDCNKLVCRSCAVELPGGYLRCVECDDNIPATVPVEKAA